MFRSMDGLIKSKKLIIIKSPNEKEEYLLFSLPSETFSVLIKRPVTVLNMDITDCIAKI